MRKTLFLIIISFVIYQLNTNSNYGYLKYSSQLYSFLTITVSAAIYFMLMAKKRKVAYFLGGLLIGFTAFIVGEIISELIFSGSKLSSQIIGCSFYIFIFYLIAQIQKKKKEEPTLPKKT